MKAIVRAGIMCFAILGSLGCAMEEGEDLEGYEAEGVEEVDIELAPTGTMNGDTSTSSGSCYAGSMVYDPTYKMNNQCCTVDGLYGTYKPSSFNKAVFLCTF
jgi:hypothetical protein